MPQLLDLEDVFSTDDDPHARREFAGDPHASPRAGGVGDCQHVGPGLGDAHVLENGGPGAVAVVNVEPEGPLVADRLGIEFEHDVGHAELGEGGGKVAAVETEAGDDHVVGEFLAVRRRGAVGEPPAAPPRLREAVEPAGEDHGEQRRGGHREHGCGQECLVVVAVEQAGFGAAGAEHERKLTDLSECGTGEQTRPRRIAGQQRRDGGHRGLPQHDRQHRDGHQRGVFGKKPNVEEHADRDEEQARQRIAKRQHLGECLVAVLALREQKAREKGPKGEREADLSGDRGGAKAGEHDGHQKELAVSQSHHRVEDSGHEDAADGEHRRHGRETCRHGGDRVGE